MPVIQCIVAQWRHISSESAVSNIVTSMLVTTVKYDAQLIAWDILLTLTSVAGNLCNKCPKWLLEQNSSYSDYFKCDLWSLSNSRAPGDPVTFWWPMRGQRLPKLLKLLKLPKLENVSKNVQSSKCPKQHF